MEISKYMTFLFSFEQLAIRRANRSISNGRYTFVSYLLKNHRFKKTAIS